MDTRHKRPEFKAYVLFFSLFLAAAYSARILDDEMTLVSPPADLSIPAGELPNGPPVAAPIPTTQPNAGTLAATAATMPFADADHALTFFMHDILGGSNPSARAMTGIVNNPAVNGQPPFAKHNGAALPMNNGNNGVMNNNNIPFLTSLGGTTTNVIHNNGNSFNNAPFGFNGGQFPAGSYLQKLMYGTMTVIDDELTEGLELGSGLVGKAQGFYVASSVDGRSQNMAFTAMFESGNYADSLSFFGVHRIAVSQSQLAIMGGTGKYVNARGFTTVKTIPLSNQTNTDGLETVLEFLVYVSY